MTMHPTPSMSAARARRAITLGRAAAGALAVALALVSCAVVRHAGGTTAVRAADVRMERAARLAALLAARDFARATSYLRANAAPGSVAAAVPEQEIDAFRTMLPRGARVVRVAKDEGHDFVAQLAGSDDRVLAVAMEIEPGAPHRLREVRPTTGDRSVLRVTLPSTHPAVGRAAELVAAFNAAGPEAQRPFVASAWQLRGAETADSALAGIAWASSRMGAPVTLAGVSPGAQGTVEIHVVNGRGRRSTIEAAVEPQAPHRIAIVGLELEPEREPTHDEVVPTTIDLPTSTVAVPLTFANGRAMADVMIEGKGPFRMQVETGCWCMEITPQVAATLGDRLESVTQDQVHRVGGGYVDHLHRVRELRLGDARLGGFVVSIGPNMPGQDGIIGLPAFRDLLVTFDYPAKQLRLERGALPQPDGKSVLPMRRIFGELRGIDLTIGGSAMPSIIDTQSGAGLLLASTVVDAVRFAAEPVATGQATNDVGEGRARRVPVRTARLADVMAIGRYTFPSQIIDIITYPPTRPRLGNIGGEVLGHFSVTMDHANNRVRFVSVGDSTSFPPSPAFRSVGLTIAALPRGNTVRVSDVAPGGAADRAGVKAGDVVVSVNGGPASTLPVDGSPQANLRRLAQSEAPLVLEVERAGRKLTVTLQSEVMVK